MIRVVVLTATVALLTGGPARADRLERAWARVQAGKPDVSAPELVGFALDALNAEAPVGRVEKALDLAERLQDRRSRSAGYGNFRWDLRARKVTDVTAVEFVMQRAAMIALAHRRRLSPEAGRKLDRLIRFGVEGIRRHRVPVTHTNVYLMKTWNCLALGQATDDAELSAEGARMLERWLIHAWESGVSEFASPSYYGVNVGSLGLIARHIKDPAVVQNAEAALGLFWTDIAANWFEPSLRVGGARSRDFDRLTGHGRLDDYLAALGWIPSDSSRADSALVSMSLWKPPASLTKPILANRPRTVLRRWGVGEGEYAVTYVGKGVCLGTSGAGFGPVDRVLAADLGGGPMTPLVSFHMDGRGDPYGVRPVAASGGHRKAFHLTPLVATVQRGGEALLLASADTADEGHFRYVTNPACLLSHLVLPRSDEVWIGDRKIELDGRGDAAAVEAGGPVFLRLGRAALGVRIVLALDTKGNPAAAALMADGSKHGAMRLTVTHSPDAPKGRGTVALWVRVGDEIDSDGDFARFRESFDQRGASRVEDGRVDVSVPGRIDKLRLFVDVWKQRRIAATGGERIDGDCVLAIDRREQGRRLIEGSEIVGRYRAVLRGKVEASVKAGEIMEAEKADLLLPSLVVATDSGASGGQFAWCPASASSVPPQGRAMWAMTVPAGGRYTVGARVMAQPGWRDGLAVRIRQRGRDVLPLTDLPDGAGGKWEWVWLRDEGDKPPRRVPLHAGPATIEVFTGGAMIDALRIRPAPQR